MKEFHNTKLIDVNIFCTWNQEQSSNALTNPKGNPDVGIPRRWWKKYR
jgi:hypothetical protein